MEKKKSLKEQLLKQLRDLENAEPEEAEDLGVQRSKYAVEEESIEDEPETIVKAKKPRTEAQMKAFEKAKEKARINAEKRKEERELAAEQERKAIEEKLVKKAISVKKKQIKKQAILDEISDDETELVEIEKIVKKLPAKKVSFNKEVVEVEKLKPNPYTFY